MFKSLNRVTRSSDVAARHYCRILSASCNDKGSFGLLFDIDGVLVRGRSIIPEAKEIFRYLLDHQQRLRVPVVYVTNAGSMPHWRKAESLSDKLGVNIHPCQVIMSHTPLQTFHHFHKKHVLFCGQGAVKHIAHSLGFQDVTTVDELRSRYPQLDVCDHRRRRPPPCAFERYNRRIEAIVLLGEPTCWERSLQLLTDVLLSNGQPYLSHHAQSDSYSTSSAVHHDPHNFVTNPYPHIPVLACNLDTTWMAEAPMPRLGHGAFLACLEGVYEKLTGRRLLYSALLGKPSEITYHFAECRLQEIAHQMHSSYLPEQGPVKRIYCIGDNPLTDVYGANLYQRYLHSQKSSRLLKPVDSFKFSGQSNNVSHNSLLVSSPASTHLSSPSYQFPMPFSCGTQDISRRSNHSLSVESVFDDSEEEEHSPPRWQVEVGVAEDCVAVLVRTGVFQVKSDPDADSMKSFLSSFGKLQHRDFCYMPELHTPHLIADHVADAVRSILSIENFPI